MNADSKCSCGSGKQYKYCCGKTPATVSLKAAFTWFLIGLLVSGIAALTWFMPDDDNSSLPAVNVTTPNINAPTNSQVQHLQYNPATNKHYFAGAGHNHWHDGPPPSVTATNPLISQPLANQPNLSGRPTPNIVNP